MKRIVLLTIGMSVGVLQAQPDITGGPLNNPSPNVIDGIYIKSNIPTKRMIPYEHVREADVIWEKRVWRVIDLREKINHTLYYPLDDFSGGGEWIRHAQRWSLWTVMRTHILRGDLTIYDPENPLALGTFDGDQFKYPLTPAPGKTYDTDETYRKEITRILGGLGPIELDDQGVPLGPRTEFGDPIYEWNEELGSEVMVTYPRDTVWLTSKDIVQYKLKEDWFFDKERSVLDVRVLGICPVVYNKDEQGTITGMRELFWLYFPQCRFVFNNYYAFNPNNDAMWFSYDDLFWKRQFNSTIIKASNVHDRLIEKYKTGVDALYESQRVTEEIRNIEHDVWDF
jgi:gliding motility associated protien GldN